MRRAAGHDARIGGVDAVDVRADLAVLGAERRRHRDGRRVAAAAAERRHFAAVGHALVAGDDDDPCRARARPATRNGRTSMMRASTWRSLVMMPDWLPVKLIASPPSSRMAIDSSAIEMRSPAVSSMSSSRRSGFGGHLLGEREQLVGRVAHRRDDDDDVVPLPPRPHHALGDLLDPRDVGDARAAVLLDDDGHAQTWRIAHRLASCGLGFSERRHDRRVVARADVLLDRARGRLSPPATRSRGRSRAASRCCAAACCATAPTR